LSSLYLLSLLGFVQSISLVSVGRCPARILANLSNQFFGLMKLAK
jgi:hypothetical protein